LSPAPPEVWELTLKIKKSKMGKVKTRLLGMEEIEEEQKKEQKEKAKEKKMAKKTEKKEEPKKEEEKKEVKVKKTKKIIVKPKGKKYVGVKKLVDKTKSYALADAVELLKKMKTTKFDAAVELHLVVDETGLKGEIQLPHSTGKSVKVTVVDDKVLDKLEQGKIDFDILVTHPSFMPRLAKFAKILGPRGLMPNPKAGTISPNPEEVVKKFEGGLLRWETEPKFPLIHQMIGKETLPAEKLLENANKFIEAVGLKHIQKAYLKSTMSPSIKLEIKS